MTETEDVEMVDAGKATSGKMMTNGNSFDHQRHDAGPQDAKAESRLPFLSNTSHKARGAHESFAGRTCNKSHWACIDTPMRKLMYKFGKLVGRHPYAVLVISILVCGVLSAGFFFIKVEDDAEKVFAVMNSKTIKHRERLMALFPTNYTHDFQPGALISTGRFVRVIIKSETNILSEASLKQIISLDNTIRSLGQGDITFNSTCAMWNQACYDSNSILPIISYNASYINRTTLTYPFHQIKMFNTVVSNIFIGATMSKPVVDSNGVVKEATSLLLSYLVRDDEKFEAASIEWTNLVITKLQELDRSLPGLEVTYFSSQTLDQELTKMSDEIMTRFIGTIVLIISFSVISCLMTDWVKSKPYLAICGVVSPGLAIASSFGLMLYFGLPITSSTSTVPFLVMAIGVDGMFVFIAAWRHTSPYLPTEKRLALTYMDAGVSVTITSITDVLALGIGASSPFMGVTNFCLYAATGCFMDLIFQITFFGACVALFGRREEANRHSVACIKATPKSQAGKKSSWYKFWCTGGVNRTSPSREDNRTHFAVRFFRHQYGPLVQRNPTRFFIMFLYCIYLGFGIYGCLNVKEGLRRQDLPLKGSYAIDFYNDIEEYYSVYTFPVQVVIDQQVQYTDVQVQNKTLDLFYLFRNNDLYHSDLARFWLVDFLDWTKQSGLIPQNETDLIRILRDNFLIKFERYRTDLHFDRTNTSVLASRFHLTSVNVDNTNKEEKVLLESRRLCDETDLNCFPYYAYFVFYEQYPVILPTMLKNLLIAIVSMFCVALLFLPHPVTSFWVMGCVTSIEVGVVGYMTLWGVRIDIIAMLCVVMCIGFSVDYSAHMAYAIIQAEPPRVPNALSLIGFPVVQSALSTLLGVAILSMSAAVIGQTFFKVIFLVTVIGAFHGLCVLPVLLDVATCCQNTKQEEANYFENNRKSRKLSSIFAENGMLQQQKQQTLNKPKIESDDEAKEKDANDSKVNCEAPTCNGLTVRDLSKSSDHGDHLPVISEQECPAKDSDNNAPRNSS